MLIRIDEIVDPDALATRTPNVPNSSKDSVIFGAFGHVGSAERKEWNALHACPWTRERSRRNSVLLDMPYAPAPALRPWQLTTVRTTHY